MGEELTLIEIISRLDFFIKEVESEEDVDLTICCKPPWNGSSLAVVIRAADDGRVAPELIAMGFEYFLEVDIAIEVIEDYCEPSAGLEEKCERVIEYATNDC